MNKMKIVLKGDIVAESYNRQFSIRKVREEDRRSIIDILNEGVKTNRTVSLNLYDYCYFDEMLEESNGDFLVLCNRTTVFGFIYFKYPYDKVAEIVVHFTVGYRKQWTREEGREADKIFMPFLFEEIMKLGVNSLLMRITSYNRQIDEMSNEWGFKEVARIQRALYKNNEYFDVIIKQLML